MAPPTASNTLSLEVCAIDRLPYRLDAKEVALPGGEGLFVVLPGHAPLVSELEIGVIRVLTVQDERKSFAIAGGVVRVLDNQVLVLSRTAEMDANINRDRAESSKKRAEERLKLQRDSINVARAEASLRRALIRLQSSGKQPQAKG
jgi:F-type H+-transporting ATPase subunit epsilon